MHDELTITTATQELHPAPVKIPWYLVGIDFIGPVTASDSDYCLKWVEAVSMPFKHASGVAHALLKVNVIFDNIGVPI